MKGDDEDDETGAPGGIRNVSTGDAANVIQAGHVHGGIHVHGPSPADPAAPRPLILAGTPHLTRHELAATLRGHWGQARHRFFAAMGTPEAPSEGWSDLVSWLRQFDDPDHDDVEGRIELIDHYLKDTALSPDVKLLHLLRWLAPEGPVVYRGRRIGAGLLIDACRPGPTDDRGGDPGLYADVRKHRLLDVFARFTRLRALTGVQSRWDDAWRTWRAAAQRVPGLPEEIRAWAGADARRPLLLTVLPYARAAEALREAAAATAEPDTADAHWCPWYPRLVEAMGGPERPPALVARSACGAFAMRVAGAERHRARTEDELGRRRRSAVEERRRREQEWRDYEAARLAPAARWRAAGRGAVWVAMWCAPGIAAAWLIWGPLLGTPDIARLVLYQAVAATAAGMGVRAALAAKLGGAYRPPISSPHRWMPTGAADVRRAAVRLAGFGVFLFLVGNTAHDFVLRREEAAIGPSPGFSLGLAVTGAFLLGFAVLAAMMTAVACAGLQSWDEEHRERRRAHLEGSREH
ncbi:hypothetical protein [Streptomonospora arabica]|uniref:Uncharacterized protein n=1 Tax=Streptomonospora arabica TaxID=412417 RepID=A0ABV9SQ72_9ACTN